MRAAVALLLIIAAASAYMGRPGPPCSLCHPPKPVADAVRVGSEVTVSGYAVDQRRGFVVVANGTHAYHVRVPRLCGEVLGYKVRVEGVEVARGRGESLIWHLIRALKCPERVGPPDEEGAPAAAGAAAVRQCLPCHQRLELVSWNATRYETEVKVFVFYLNSTSVGVAGNAFWHLINCNVTAGWNEVSGTVVEEGAGRSEYKVLICR
ncbi:MAG: hypothetical protein GXO07_02900 [Crenarchaeota archaeon]|nr:hypothetical protein [Thermoproteota archaeon]